MLVYACYSSIHVMLSTMKNALNLYHCESTSQHIEFVCPVCGHECPMLVTAPCMQCYQL